MTTTPRAATGPVDVPEATRADAPPAVWRDRGFLRYLAGFGLSLLGDQVWFVALAWAATRLDNPAQASFVLAAGSLPRAVLILFGGTLADRWGALRVTLVSQAARVVTMLAAVALAVAAEPRLWTLALVAMVFGAVDAAHMPAAAALPPQLLPRDALPAGQGLVQTLERVATIVGAPVGGLIVALGGLSAAAAANALLFVAALVILRALRLRPSADHTHPAGPSEPEGTWRALRGGLAYAIREPVLGPVLLVVTVLNLAIAAPLNVGVALLSDARGWQAAGFSAIIAGFGTGATVGALSVVRFRPRRRPAAVGLIWVIAGSLCIGALGFSPSLLVAVGAAAALGVTSGPASALLLGLVQARTHTRYLGRVMALVTFSALGLVPVSYTAFGALVEATSLPASFVICAAAELFTALAALAVTPLRRAAL
ncbi:MFS transporter [Catellatospora sp. NPDC049111]|uniref:MFS transporter n=1 Tax=Catellatospora sp. NPDC049111 TaxID=3155271 RepID=UPI0033D82313